MATPSLKVVIQAASVLVGVTDTASPKPKTLAAILSSRLDAFNSLSVSWPSTTPNTSRSLLDTLSEIELKKLTAEHALNCLLLISDKLNNNQLASTSPSSSSQPRASTSTSSNVPSPPLFGSRDLKVLSMLSGVIGRWGLAALVLEGVLPSSLRDAARKQKSDSSTTTGRFSEITQEDEEEERVESELLREMTSSVLGVAVVDKNNIMVTPTGERQQLASIVLHQLLIPLLGSLLQLGSFENLDWAKEGLGKLCLHTPPSVIFSSLLSLLSSASSTLTWTKPAISSLLSQQLLRNGGVKALLTVVIGPDDEVGLPKLEMLSKLLATKPVELSYEYFFSNVVPQLHGIIKSGLTSSSQSFKSSTPISVVRSACFILSHLIDLFPSPNSGLSLTFLPLLHSAFLPIEYPPISLREAEEDTEFIDDPVALLPSSISDSLQIISIILLHAPPSPNLIPYLLSPIISSLFSLSFFATKVSSGPSIGIIDDNVENDGGDEELVEEVGAILEMWGKALPVQEVVSGIIRMIETLESGKELGGQEYYWSRKTSGGGVCIRRRTGAMNDDEDEGTSTDLKIDAEAMVEWLKKSERKEVQSKLFLRWLDEVQALRSQDGFLAAKQSLVRLQLVLKMVEEFGSDVLQDPPQIIEFVAHALDARDTSSTETKSKSRKDTRESRETLERDDLKFVNDDVIEEDVRDEEDENAGLGLGPDEMALTALTLLLAVLEANEDLSMASMPLLSLIFSKLEDISSTSTSPLVPPLAREARLVLSSRQASLFGAAPSSTSKDGTSSDPLAASRVKYQEALKLLQDPLLPVRAQGLSILRSLILDKSALLSTDPALLPAVLDIFVQAVEDDDSFLYLNAIQGLSSMVDSYGKQIVQKLVLVYRGGREVMEIGSGDKGSRELDKRLRVGETLERVVTRAGEALALFVDDLIPTLLAILRHSKLPTVLRSSALTILTAAIESAPSSLLPYADVLAEGCLTLLSIESHPLKPKATTTSSKSKAPVDPMDSDDEATETAPPVLDRYGKLKRPEETAQPLQADAKHPVLRRSAILFLGMLFRTARNIEDELSERTVNYDERNPLGALKMGGGIVRSGRSGRLVASETKKKARIVLGYVGVTDEDALVRHQATEVLDEMAEF